MASRPCRCSRRLRRSALAPLAQSRPAPPRLAAHLRRTRPAGVVADGGGGFAECDPGHPAAVGATALAPAGPTTAPAPGSPGTSVLERADARLLAADRAVERATGGGDADRGRHRARLPRAGHRCRSEQRPRAGAGPAGRRAAPALGRRGGRDLDAAPRREIDDWALARTDRAGTAPVWLSTVDPTGTFFANRYRAILPLPAQARQVDGALQAEIERSAALPLDTTVTVYSLSARGRIFFQQ